MGVPSIGQRNPFENTVTSQATKVDERIQFSMKCGKLTLNKIAKLSNVIVHNSLVVSDTIQHVSVLN